MGIHIEHLNEVFTVEHGDGTGIYYTYHQKESFVYSKQNPEDKVVNLPLEYDQWAKIDNAIKVGAFSVVGDEHELFLEWAPEDEKIWEESTLPVVFTVRNYEEGEWYGEIYTYDVENSLVWWLKPNGQEGTDTLDELPHAVIQLNKGLFVMLDDSFSLIEKSISDAEDLQAPKEEHPHTLQVSELPAHDGGASLYKEDKGVVSDGGKSAYYEIVLPQWLLDKQELNGSIMLEDLAEVMYGNDFNYTNIFKAQKRMFALECGVGKKGNDLAYDANKCKYYVDKQLEVFNRNK